MLQVKDEAGYDWNKTLIKAFKGFYLPNSTEKNLGIFKNGLLREVWFNYLV